MTNHRPVTRPGTWAHRAREERVANRLREVIGRNGLIPARVGESIGIPGSRRNTGVINFLNGSIPFGPSRLGKVEAWLDRWDAGDIDHRPLKVDHRLNRDTSLDTSLASL